MTGIRQGPIYRRRVRGAHKGLKRMLVEGMDEGADGQNTWRGFSGALVRQAVGDAVSSLPPRQKRLIKLAYFSDLSNREIAQDLGITIGSVERGLRQAVARVSEHVERGRAAGRRAIYAIAMLLGGRRLGEAHQAAGAHAQQLVRAGALVLATATAGAAMLAVHPALPAQPAHVDRPGVAVAAAGGSVVLPREAPAVQAVTVEPPAGAAIEVAVPTPAVPQVKLPPAEVNLPPLPVVSLRHGLLGA
jgi:DNA-binding CsgD family transcriptional regulator